MRFTALLHHVTPALLRASYWELNRIAVPGIDGETWKEYRAQMEERIIDLHERVQRGRYRAKPSKRAWIAKAGGQRPLGIAALEDKIVQQAVRKVLEEILEAEFVGLSYGFRPGRSAHDALDALWVGLMERRINWVLDCNIRGFFDAIVHEWLMKFIEHRVGDRRAPDWEMAPGGSIRRGRVVQDGSGYAAGIGDFTVSSECVLALCVGFVGDALAQAPCAGGRYRGAVCGRFRHGFPTSVGG
jgi:Reverse transcriptase (RNA-dependent DNA polymerase)